MPLYRITAPNGRTYQIEGPEGASDADVARAVMSQFPDAGTPAPETTVGGNIKEAIKGVLPGAVGLLETAATGASALLPEDMEKAAREKIASVAGVAKKPFEAAPGYEQSVGRRVGEGLGSFLPVAPLGFLGLPGVAAGVGMGVAAGAGEARQRAEQEGTTAEERSKATALGTIPGGFDTAVDMALAALPGGLGKSLSMVRRALASAGVEGATEAAQAIAQNAIAKGIYKPDQALLESAGEEGAYGAGVGAIASVLLDMAIPGRTRGAAAPMQPGAKPGAQPPAQGELFGAQQAPVPTQPELDLRGQPLVRGAAPEEGIIHPITGETVMPSDPRYADVLALKGRGPVPPEQADLGLDYARKAEDVTLEVERLKAQPQTPEVKERIAQLQDDLQTYSQLQVEALRADKAAAEEQAKEDAKARKKFPALAQAPELMAMPDEVKARTQGELFTPEEMGGAFTGPQVVPGTPTPQVPTEPTPVPPYARKGEYQKKLPLRGGEAVAPLTMQDIVDTGVPLSTTRNWFEQNVVGKTPAEVQALVDKTPSLLEGKGKRAKVLRELLAPRPATFEEPVNVPSPAKEPAAQQGPEPRAGEPSLGVPGGPAAPIVSEPGAGVAGPAEAPAAPVGRGLVPSGQPAVPGTQAQGVEPAAVDEEEVQRQREAAEMAEAMARQQGRAGRERVAPPRAEVTPTAPESQPIPEKLYEPVGTSEYGMEEGQKEILRGPQAMLFPMSKREEIAYAERRGPETEPAEPGAPANMEKDARQLELPLAPPAAPAKKAAPKPAATAPAKVAHTEPMQNFADHFGGNVVAFDGNVGLVKVPHHRTGEATYIPIRADGTYSQNAFGIQSLDQLLKAASSKVFSRSELSSLAAAAGEARAEDARLAAKYPDGPFTGAKSNVVGGESVDPRYVSYLHDLMESLGLGKVRVFLYHSADAKEEAQRLHGSYYPIMARAQAKDTAKGATRAIGPSGKDFMLFVKQGMSEAETIEVINHELGHMIQQIAFDNAPQHVKDAVQDEHDAWLQSLKGKTAEDLVHSLRNRAAAEMVVRESPVDLSKIPVDKIRASDRLYWTSFAEWFADNVSRWTTTAEKPLTVADKFFAKVAQMMRDLVATVTGRKYPPAKTVADFMEKMGPSSADAWLAQASPGAQTVQPLQDAVSFSTESLIEGMGPLDPPKVTGLKALIPSFKAGMSPAEPGYAVKFRTQAADAAATIEHRLREQFDGAVRDSLGKLNPMGLYRQAQDYTKTLLEYFQVGGLVKDSATGLWVVQPINGVRPPAEVYSLIDAWGAKNGYDRERATRIASRVLEGVRLDAMRTANKTEGTNFLLHLSDAEIDQLVAEYKADPDLQEMSKAMDEARLAMVDNMVAAGRLTPEQGQQWKAVAGYVPFDRIDDFASSFSKVKKVSNKGLAQVGKLPELVGSLNRPVGNVFDNYLNTLGWMVGQTMKTDATVQTLRSLEDLNYAKFLGRSTQQKENTVGAYVGGEMMYWELPSKYDVLAFKDLNPPKAGWLRNMGKVSNVLRKSVTALPPFALKQVTDDVQRAIMTSGVKNPGALLRMSLSNFGGVAFAELRGIQHPAVKQFGRMGLTGEYDFEAGKPATSLLKDLGYKKRGKFETLRHRLDGITRASDLAVRKAIYDQTLKETGDQLLAQTRAREFINFRRRGASDFVGAMVTTIPFFNAYIQGMDVLYRAASGKDSSSSVGRAEARRMFWSRAATVMMLSSLYALGKGDDEDYAEMDLRTRDSNWILPGGLKLPVPTELGALFKVIPERVVEYMRRQGTPEEQTAWEATRTALSYMFEQYVGRTVPVPQAVKPLLEAWTNYSFFTGRELEGIYQKQQDPSMRRAANTSELAIAIANFSRDVIGVDKVSPILVDNALNGYFGSSAGLLVAMTDSLLNPTRVDRPLHKWALVSNYMYDPVGTRRMTEFYETREKVGRANATLNELAKTDLDRAAKYAEENADLLMLEGAVNSTLEQLERTRAYRKYLNSPDAAQSMPKDAREAELQELRKMEVELTGWLREARNVTRQ